MCCVKLSLRLKGRPPLLHPVTVHLSVLGLGSRMTPCLSLRCRFRRWTEFPHSGHFVFERFLLFWFPAGVRDFPFLNLWRVGREFFFFLSILHNVPFSLLAVGRMRRICACRRHRRFGRGFMAAAGWGFQCSVYCTHQPIPITVPSRVGDVPVDGEAVRGVQAMTVVGGGLPGRSSAGRNNPPSFPGAGGCLPVSFGLRLQKRESLRRESLRRRLGTRRSAYERRRVTAVGMHYSDLRVSLGAVNISSSPSPQFSTHLVPFVRMSLRIVSLSTIHTQYN